MSVVATNGTPSLNYQWEESDDNGVGDPWADAVGGSGSATNAYTTPALAATRYYRVLVSATGNGCTTATSPGVAVTVNPQPVGPTLNVKTPNLASVCDGQVVSATFIAGSGGVGCTDAYQYRFDGAGGWLSYTGGTNLNTAGHTLVEIQGQRAGCTVGAGCTGTGWVTLATWAVNPYPVLTSTATPDPLCNGLVFSYTPTSDVGGTSFVWNRATIGGITPVGPTSGTDSPNELLTNTTASPISVRYVYTLTANGCTNPTTFNVDVLVNPTSVITSGATANWCNNISNTYTAASSSSTATFAWTRAVVGGISNPDRIR